MPVHERGEQDHADTVIRAAGPVPGGPRRLPEHRCQGAVRSQLAAVPARRQSEPRLAMDRPPVTVRVLGAVEIVDGAGDARDVPGRRLQTLLARLVAEPEHVVSVDALLDAVWQDGLPGSPEAALQTQVFRLRKRLR